MTKAALPAFVISDPAGIAEALAEVTQSNAYFDFREDDGPCTLARVSCCDARPGILTGPGRWDGGGA